MKRPLESDYTSHVAYTRALEAYCDSLEQDEQWTPDDMAYRPGGSTQPEQGTLMTKDEVLTLALAVLKKVSRRAVIMGSTGDYRSGQKDALDAVSEDVAPAIKALEEALAIEAKLKEKNT